MRRIFRKHALSGAALQSVLAAHTGAGCSNGCSSSSAFLISPSSQRRGGGDHLFIVHDMDGTASCSLAQLYSMQRRFNSSSPPPSPTPTLPEENTSKSNNNNSNEVTANANTSSIEGQQQQEVGKEAIPSAAANQAVSSTSESPTTIPNESSHQQQNNGHDANNTTTTTNTTQNEGNTASEDAATASPATKPAEERKKTVLPLNISGNAVPPKGFERYFQREIVSQLPSTFRNPSENVKDPKANERAMELSPEELRILETQNNLRIYHQRVKKVSILMVVMGMLILFKSYRAWTLMSNSSDITDLKTVRMSKKGHVATFYDEKLKPVAMQYFIDARTFHEEMTNRGKDVLVGVPTYFPLIPMMLLCLLPMMAMMSGAFNASARMAAKAGRNAAAGGGGGGGGGGMPGADGASGRFRFKKEVEIQTRLDDVAGLTEAKHEVTEVIDFLKNPQRYRELGANLPKGVLLDGPPGVGKTLLAKAVAGEAMVNFVSCSGSEFEEVYVGVGAQRVRELFKQARASRPCVVFIDEIDAFGRKRQSDRGGNSRSTLNAFLSELDGFHDASGIIVLAATNRADVLDNALTRSGRFDRKISIDKPPHKDRVAIAKVHLKPLKLDPAMTLDGFAEALASLTPGCSGADIFNICNESAIIASREDRDFVNIACFHKAIDRVLVGMEKRATKLSVHEKARLAYHEAGHAVLNWFLPLPDPITKVSIAPRGTQIGTTQKLPHEVFIKTQDRLRQAMVAKLGGFVSEEYFFNDLSSSAAEDLQRVTDEARAEICVYGMDPEVGNFGYEMNDSDAIQKPFGPRKEDQIDVAVARVVESCAEKARALLRVHINHVHTVAGALLKQETMTAQELYVVLGERPEMSEEFRKYLES